MLAGDPVCRQAETEWGGGWGETPLFSSDASGITLVKETGQLTTLGSKVWPKGAQVLVSIVPCPSIMYCLERRKRPLGKSAKGNASDSQSSVISPLELSSVR